MRSSSESLPRIAYVADVPVEASYHGSALVHRLLSEYPKDRICILEFFNASEPRRRLPDVAYATACIGAARLMRTRLSTVVTSFMVLAFDWLGRPLTRRIAAADPQAIVTVAHGFSWILAAYYARSNSLPLHIIIHDDWITGSRFPRLISKRLRKLFKRACECAVSLFCISDTMANRYKVSHDSRVVILHPARAKDAPRYDGPPDRLSANIRSLRAAYAGASLHAPGNRVLLVDCAKALAEIGGRLAIYGPYTESELADMGLDFANVDFYGLLPSSDLIRTLRDAADVLIAQMSFLEEDRLLIESSFPSRMTDYTATALPILIYAPPYADAVKWARANGGAIVIDQRDQRELTETFTRLAADAALRVKLGATAQAVGDSFFDAARASDLFQSRLRMSAPEGRTTEIRWPW
jgi:glycosyltransferase involved in cell wall biosynthesis